MKMDEIKKQLEEARNLLDAFLSNQDNLKNIQLAGELLVDCINNENKIISCGNGGSMADAMHFAEELTGRFRDDRNAIAAVAISDPAHITCVANDYGFEYIFSRYIEAVGKKGDVLLAISTSGNSANVINAIQEAQSRGMKVIALTGKDGGGMSDICDIEIRVAHTGYSDRIQEIHIKVIHLLIDYLERKLWL
ncbi:MAG: D-sedoheptulose 7-phosphate isomerase [Bacteroidetes bacterium]|nr:D-sedoheptulose 7-phosphate isomerase [Bacteroidota bacterium]MBT5530471.1 D-sedoheptulose 7-phosphate isomerase [Cytophagia bacterium]MBT3423118.1 D-sedoheptulose 7-phosphate isomerase [Bacteroidota bacterium]MBT3800943.1 D-sedoheptulose 7-phosphate isomerase [Bacteroidota bacterium]MBT3935824.1 D-sedoheptulose 7-phosphate isomerase [Bacteroidota bacterium]